MSVYSDRALKLQAEGFSCSQCVVASMCDEFGIDHITALRFAGAFGSGIGCTTETCGAITGAMMLIGLKYGRRFPDDPNDGHCFEVAQEFVDRFKAKHDGKFKCRDLLGADARTEEGLQSILDNDLYTKVCRELIRDGVDIIAELLILFSN